MSALRPALLVSTAWLALGACTHAEPPPAASAAAAAPAATAAPAPTTSDVDARLKALDQRLDALADRVEAIARMEGEPGAPEAPPAATSHGDVDMRIAEILDRLDHLEQRIGANVGAGYRPAPRPPRPRPPGPNATDVYSVPLGSSPSVGPRYAKVTIVKAFDFACPFCNRARQTMDQLRKEYGKDLRIVYKNLVVHRAEAMLPAQAGCAAARQGKFAEMHRLIYDKAFAARQFDQAMMDKLAQELGLDMRRFHADTTGPCVKVVQNDMALMSKLGVRGTPGFFINGRFLSGARPIDQFKPIIDEELDKANARIRKGTRLRDYYDIWVIQKGKTSP